MGCQRVSMTEERRQGSDFSGRSARLITRSLREIRLRDNISPNRCAKATIVRLTGLLAASPAASAAAVQVSPHLAGAGIYMARTIAMNCGGFGNLWQSPMTSISLARLHGADPVSGGDAYRHARMQQRDPWASASPKAPRNGRRSGCIP